MDRKFASLCIAGLLAGCATTQPPAPPAAPLPAPAPVLASAGSFEELKARLLDLKDIALGGEAAALPPAPIYVEFVGSPLLSSVVAQDLKARGASIAGSKASAASVLTMSGRIQLDGSIGRRYFEVGETFERIAAKDAAAADIAQRSMALDAGGGARDAALTRAVYKVGLFDKFLRNYFTVLALSDALGVRGGFNSLVAGDPRGFCLSNCEHWKHIHHTVILHSHLESAQRSSKGSVTVKAWMAQVDPQPVFDVAYEALVSQRLLLAKR